MKDKQKRKRKEDKLRKAINDVKKDLIAQKKLKRGSSKIEQQQAIARQMRAQANIVDDDIEIVKNIRTLDIKCCKCGCEITMHADFDIDENNVLCSLCTMEKK